MTCAKFQNDTIETEGLLPVYTGRETDITKSTQLVTRIIHIYVTSCSGYKTMMRDGASVELLIKIVLLRRIFANIITLVDLKRLNLLAY